MHKEISNTEMTIEEPLELLFNETGIRPFLKWAGGKTQLLPHLHHYAPKTFNKYIEPFIGGGAMYFSLNAEQSIIADSNEELIIAYQQVQSNVEEVINHLRTFHNNEEYYYEIRQMDPSQLTPDFRAARLIYLNKTCFNGLYRVNKKGHFNVPFGKKTTKFLHEEVLRNANGFLQNAVIQHGDYLNILRENANPGDFIFLDPPYYPISKYSDFKRYTKEFFHLEDQINLKKEFDRLVNMGCHVLLTNSDHQIILDLYANYEIKTINTKRMISSNAKTRTGKDIIVIGSND